LIGALAGPPVPEPAGITLIAGVAAMAMRRRARSGQRTRA
jgi:hypothetical protein